RRWRLIAGFTLGSVLLMGIGCLLVERRFTATALLHVDNQPPQVTNLPQVVAAPNYLESVEFFQDQVKFLQSRTLAGRVTEQPDREHNRDFRPPAPAPGPVDATIGAASRTASALVSWVRERFRQTTAAPADAGAGSGDAPVGHIARYLRSLEVKPVT